VSTTEHLSSFTLDALALGALAPAEAASAQQHLAGCAACSRQLEAARAAGEEFARSDPAAIGEVWTSLVGEDFRPMLARISQPTLIVHGANSHLYGADTADHLVAALPNARAIAFERSGHSPHIEQPELFNRTIRDFAARLPRLRETQTTI
jgi:pimeloyl-[acyl-carrier protein] methyl ester esterase